MAREMRAADINACIECFYNLGEPCGAAGRAGAVRCGVCINNCRKCCCGFCGSCIAGTIRHCISLCGNMFHVLLALAAIGVCSYVVWVNWDSISQTAVEVYDYVEQVVLDAFDQIKNWTVGFFNWVKEKIWG